MTPPTCSCGAHYSRDTPQQAHCRPCIEKAAEKRSQDPTSTATVYPMTVLRLCKAIKREPGWPKGLVTVGGVITICNEGEINRHAHAGTLLLVCNEHTTIEDIRREVA